MGMPHVIRLKVCVEVNLGMNKSISPPPPSPPPPPPPPPPPASPPPPPPPPPHSLQVPRSETTVVQDVVYGHVQFSNQQMDDQVNMRGPLSLSS